MSDTPAIVGGVFETTGGVTTLLAGRCRACGFPAFPRPVVCPSCAGGPVDDLSVTGPGTLFGWTAVTAAPAGYTGPVPYGFGIVAFDEGLRVLGRLTEADPDRLSFGQAMRIVTDTVPTPDGDALVWAFAPEGS